MESKFDQIQELEKEKLELESRLKILFDGQPAVKTVSNQKYLYLRKKVLGKYKSEYVGKYSDLLYDRLLAQNKERKQLTKRLREINLLLADLGYSNSKLSAKVIQNIEFARINLKYSIYDQAMLEGVSATLSDTEDILNNAKVSEMTPSDIQKIVNLKHAWEFIMDEDVLSCPTDMHLLSHIAKLVNEGFFTNGGKIRTVPVKIGGSTYHPVIPNELAIREAIKHITHNKQSIIDQAIDLCLYVMRTQIFLDGNKRTGVIFANHYLISHGQGILVVPDKSVNIFKKMLVDYYESNDRSKIKAFLKEKCWQHLE